MEEEEEKEKEEKGEARKKKWVEKVQRKDRTFLHGEDERRKKVKEGQKKNRRPRARHVLGKSGRWLFLLLLMEQSWLCVNAAAEGLQRMTEMTERTQQQEVQVKESRWMEETPQR